MNLDKKVFDMLCDYHSDEIQNVALPGGTTSKFLFNAIEMSIKKKMNYRFLMTDERQVNTDSNQSNIGNYIRNVENFANSGFYNILSEKDKKIVERDQVDLAFLGFGLDGHFASIFSMDDFNNVSRNIIHTFNKEKQKRVSLSVKCLKKTKKTFIVYADYKKKEILKDDKRLLLINLFIKSMEKNIEVINYG